jgi:hypothetical protein
VLTFFFTSLLFSYCYSCVMDSSILSYMYVMDFFLSCHICMCHRLLFSFLSQLVLWIYPLYVHHLWDFYIVWMFPSCYRPIYSREIVTKERDSYRNKDHWDSDLTIGALAGVAVNSPSQWFDPSSILLFFDY